MVKRWLAILLIGIMTACASSEDPVYDPEAGYKKSTINEDFIVPINAVQEETEFGNPNILKGSKYYLKDIGGEQGLYPPMQYFQDLEKEGWGELKDRREGHVHFFKKRDTVISVVVNQDFFSVYEWKQDAKF